MHPQASRTLALRTSTVAYPGSTEHVAAVRADLRPLLRDCPVADDVILCASELAANAAVHSLSRLPGGTFTVRAEINPGEHPDWGRGRRRSLDARGERLHRPSWAGYRPRSRNRLGCRLQRGEPHDLGKVRLA